MEKAIEILKDELDSVVDHREKLKKEIDYHLGLVKTMQGRDFKLVELERQLREAIEKLEG